MYIPKPDGKQRPLGIPPIKDRVVETAALIVLEPIFEADLQPEQHAYREDHSAQAAVQAVHRLLIAGYREVVDADLSGYFDSIPHAELMRCITRRVSDKAMLHLIKLWLVAPVEEKDARGRAHRTTRNKDEGRGSPQGAPISPLLANLYMRRFVLGWKVLGHERAFQARIVNYADDFVICCRRNADQAMQAMRDMMTRLKLTVNESQDARLSRPGRIVRLSGLHIWAHVCTSDGPALYRRTPFQEEGRSATPGDQRADERAGGAWQNRKRSWDASTACFAAGRTTSPMALSTVPIVPWITIRAKGSVSGCVASTR